MKLRYFIRGNLYLPVTSFLLAGREREAPLSDQSVVETGAVEREKTGPDKWILDTFTLPYGIGVEYRWNKNVMQSGSRIYSSGVASVKNVLKAIKALWTDPYTGPGLGREKFLLGRNPLKIYMYGGRDVDRDGVELLDSPEATTNEIFPYNINGFDPRNEGKIFILMRSVHHQFARRLMELFPCDRSSFLSISRNKYIESITPITWIFKGETHGRRVFVLAGYANRKGFFTYHSLLSPEKNFTEVISSKLTHTPKDIPKALTGAETPYTAGLDQDPQNAYNEQTVQAYKELTEKRKLVEDCFSKGIKISLNYLQLRNIKQLKAFTKQG